MSDLSGQARHALAERRRAAGLSVSELARRLGVTRTAVQKWQARGVPAQREAAVSDALTTAPAPAADPAALEQLAALVRAEPALSPAQLRKRAPHLAVALEAAERAGLVHQARVAVVDAAGRHYSRLRVLPGPAPAAADVPTLTGHDVAGLRVLHGRSQAGLASLLRVSRQWVVELEQGAVPEGRQEELRRLLVESLATLDLPAARRRVGLSQAELARRLGRQPSQVNLWERGKRAVPVADAVAIGHVLAAAVDEDPVEDARQRVVEIVTAAAAAGTPCTANDLARALSRGRRRGQTGAGAADAAGLALALRRRQVHWRSTWTRRRNGDWRETRRLHPGPRRRSDDEEAMSGAELRAARLAAGVSQSQLANALGTVWGTVSKWERRGRRPVPPAVGHAAREVLERLAAERPDPRAQARVRLAAAAAAQPGLTRAELLRAAGYGKANRTALAVLAELVDASELHLRLTPDRTGPGAHLAVYPGPAPADVLPAPMPGRELSRRRVGAGLRQRDLADALGVEQTAVSHWERTSVPPLRVAQVDQVLAELALPALTGEQLRQARLAAGMSLPELGAAAGVTGPAVAQWEHHGVPRARLQAVREALPATA